MNREATLADKPGKHSRRELRNIKIKRIQESHPDRDLGEFLKRGRIFIPNKYLQKVISEALDKWETGTMLPMERDSRVAGTVTQKRMAEYSKVHTVAPMVPMSPQKLQKIVDGEGHTVFETVDRLLLYLDLENLWYHDENLSLAYSLVF